MAGLFTQGYTVTSDYIVGPRLTMGAANVIVAGISCSLVGGMSAGGRASLGRPLMAVACGGFLMGGSKKIVASYSG